MNSKACIHLAPVMNYLACGYQVKRLFITYLLPIYCLYIADLLLTYRLFIAYLLLIYCLFIAYLLLI